jgi:hypothetical protein
MTDLSFTVIDSRPAAHAAAPGVTFRVRAARAAAASRVHAMVLRAQVQIEPHGRTYSAGEEEQLYELFGDRTQWDRTLRSVTWAQTTAVTPGFDASIDVELHVPCTYDLDVAAAKYFHALRDGEARLLFLFTGTLFETSDGGLHVTPIAWESEAAYRMPAAVWHDAMRQFFGDGAWIRIGRETLDALHGYRGRRALVSWDAVVQELLAVVGPAQAGQNEP